MYSMSMWALIQFIRKGVTVENGMNDPVPWVAIVLVALAALVLIEAIRVFVSPPPSTREPEPAIPQTSGVAAS